MKKNHLLLLLFFTINCFSQFSKTHYIPPVSNSDVLEPQGQYMYISTPNTTPVSFQIIAIGGATTTGTVSRDTPYVFDIGFGADTQFLINSSDANTVKNNKGYIVEAADMVYVSVRFTTTQQNYHAGGVVSKGLAALGTRFRIGAFTNKQISNTLSDNYYTFATILATENNTVISFADIKPGVSLVNNAAAGNTPANITLNAGESYAIAVQGQPSANADGLIGALITATKPIAVNCGSIAGSNGSTSNLDMGLDQIVSAERTGKEYIFIKGNGLDVVERPTIVIDKDNTTISLNGVPFTTLNAGQYLSLDGTSFSANNNLYVSTNENVFAYQGLGGSDSQANQNMHFLPPLNCQTPKVINNIPLINEVGGDSSYTATVNLVTETGAILTFIINGVNYTSTTLPSGIVLNGPFSVTGNTNFVTYTLENLTGNVSVFSTKQLYLSCFGSSGAATYGGFYSGFTYNPEVIFNTLNVTQTSCIPNVDLTINSISNFDTYQWFYNGAVVATNTLTYTPTLPGYYKVIASLTGCGLPLASDLIPVSNCADDTDNDGINDNIDLDIDNDGIINCTESYGNQTINLSNTATGTIAVGSYSNSFMGAITTAGTATPSATPFVGASDGSFVSEVPMGKSNKVTYTMNFAQPISLALEYVATANSTDLLNSDSQYKITCQPEKTLTVLNPSNQLLIDTNYDGIYESGVTKFSSFDVRFRLNSTTPLAAGTGTFKFFSDLTNSISFTQENLSESSLSRATLKVYAVCVPKDSDGDGIPDQLDIDSDNDGILDYTEAQGAATPFIALSHVDANNDGIDDAFGTGITPADTDNDGIVDYLDLDSDNDGIYDLTESGSNAADTNLNGIIDGTSFGTNGLATSVQTSPNNGVLNYTVADTDADGIINSVELDSDNDGCNDVLEAGFTDANGDGMLGAIAPPIVNINGVVTSGSGYTTPNGNYNIPTPITITTQPIDVTICELQNTSFTVVTSTPTTSYQWQVSTDNGVTWTNVTNNVTYSGATTITLSLTGVSPTMSGYKYRVYLNRTGNICGVYSAEAILTTYALPVITTPITLVQCDDDTDGISTFNLTVKNSFISSNYTNETFTYYTNSTDANAGSGPSLITTPLTYTSGNTTVYARVENANGCYRVATMNLVVSVTQIPLTFHRTLTKCDDYIDASNNNYDGISTFDFTSVQNDIQALLPATATYVITYYKTEADALSEQNAISSITNYRNIGFPNTQQIWVRVDSNLDNACFGLGNYLTLVVEPTPVFHTVGTNNVIRQCDDDQDGIYNFNVTTLSSDILQGQTNISVSYYDTTGTLINPLPNPLPVNGTKTINVRLTNNPSTASDGPCYVEKTVQFIVEDLPEAFSVATMTECDDEVDPANQDGSFPFNTSTVQSTILGTQTGMNITYTLANGTVLTTLPNPFNSVTQDVVVKVENPVNTTCFATTTLHFVVHPLPRINLNTNHQDDEIVCTNLPTFTVTLNAEITDGTSTSNYTYQWYLNGTAITSATNYSITVNTAGTYTVDVTNSFGCKRTRSIIVTASDIAHIQNINVVDLVDNNTVEVIVNGTGNYVYALDESYDQYQTSNFFENVTIGFHTVYIKDLNGCGIAEQIISVLGAPKYFTPNGDGYNDYWNIKGINSTFYPNTIIYIFDRFGKLLKQISPLSPGWDGMYNSNLAPSDDYWFTAKFDDNRSAKGHFTLKR
jgi:gliding motility-associated-like protein